MSPRHTSECNKRFNRKDVMLISKERVFAKDIEGFPLDILVGLINNHVGSNGHLAAIKAAIEYSKKTSTRFIISLEDGEAVLDTFKPVESHAAHFRKLIHDNMFLRTLTRKANDSKCVEYFTELKVSGTTGLKEFYVAKRLKSDPELTHGHIRGSKENFVP